MRGTRHHLLIGIVLSMIVSAMIAGCGKSEDTARKENPVQQQQRQEKKGD